MINTLTGRTRSTGDVGGVLEETLQIAGRGQHDHRSLVSPEFGHDNNHFKRFPLTNDTKHNKNLHFQSTQQIPSRETLTRAPQVLSRNSAITWAWDNGNG